MRVCPYCREPIVLEHLVRKPRAKKAKASTEKEKQYARKAHAERKLRVLTHYGWGKSRCIECGENRLACLSVDHIGGGGLKHRKELGINSGSAFYSWLEKNGYPRGYQTLCMNCQYIKKEENKEV